MVLIAASFPCDIGGRNPRSSGAFSTEEERPGGPVSPSANNGAFITGRTFTLSMAVGGVASLVLVRRRPDIAIALSVVVVVVVVERGSLVRSRKGECIKVGSRKGKEEDHKENDRNQH